MYEDIIKKAAVSECFKYALKQAIFIFIKLSTLYILITYISALIMPNKYIIWLGLRF